MSLWGAGGIGYGQTECMGVLTAPGLGGMGTHGRAIPGLQIRVLTPDGGDVAPGEVGEISARGMTVMVGYYNRPELNARRFENGWYRTGDLGRREIDGSLTWVGPRGRMVKSALENIYVAEVEACIAQHPDVREVGIIGVPDKTWGQRVKAIVVAAPQAELSEAAIIEHCRSRLASYKKPSIVVVREQPLPRAGAGIDYGALDEEYGGGGYPGSQEYQRNAQL
jgi:acyl-CoA synthetase (AMP-forming)/AMP-acid ligase II